jgi:hypothetical protein
MFSFSELHVRQGAGSASLRHAPRLPSGFKNQEAGSEVRRFIGANAAWFNTKNLKITAAARAAILRASFA